MVKIGKDASGQEGESHLLIMTSMDLYGDEMNAIYLCLERNIVVVVSVVSREIHSCCYFGHFYPLDPHMNGDGWNKMSSKKVDNHLVIIF